MNTHHHGERGEQNAAERGADSQTKEKSIEIKYSSFPDF